MLDLKDNMSQNILSEFNGMTGGMSGLMEGILNNMLKIDDQEDGTPGLLSQVLTSVMNNTQPDESKKAMPRVPICAAEDAIATVIRANQGKIEDTNNNILDGIDTFLGDMMSELSGAGGMDINNLFSKLGNIKGNMKTALDFDNIKQNVYSFQEPPNEAVSDYYTFCSGGAGQKQTSLPSTASIADAASEVKKAIANPEDILAFAEPPKNALDVDLLGAVSTIAGEII
jgi:hypothetical protein